MACAGTGRRSGANRVATRAGPTCRSPRWSPGGRVAGAGARRSRLRARAREPGVPGARDGTPGGVRGGEVDPDLREWTTATVRASPRPRSANVARNGWIGRFGEDGCPRARPSTRWPGVPSGSSPGRRGRGRRAAVRARPHAPGPGRVPLHWAPARAHISHSTPATVSVIGSEHETPARGESGTAGRRRRRRATVARR